MDRSAGDFGQLAVAIEVFDAGAAIRVGMRAFTLFDGGVIEINEGMDFSH
jgi:hypothetical protein